MSVLVKGMKIPQKCYECDFEYAINRCPLVHEDTDEVRFTKRLNGCPLVELPEKHGRLIDADKLIEDLKHDIAIDQDSLNYEELNEINRKLIQDDKDIKQNAIDLLEHTSYIIEAEGAEE